MQKHLTGIIYYGSCTGETALKRGRFGIQPSTITAAAPGHGAFLLLLFPAGFKQVEVLGAEVFARADDIRAGIYKQTLIKAPEGHIWECLSFVLGWDCTELRLHRVLLASPAQLHGDS